jgi:small subunit ribosomal protein S7
MLLRAGLLAALRAQPVLEASSSIPSTCFQGPHSWHQLASIRQDAKGQAKRAQQTKKKEQQDLKAQLQGEKAADSADYHEDSVLDEKDATRIVIKAVENVIPHLDVRTLSTHTKTTYVPGAMPLAKGRSLALRWLVKAAHTRARSSKNSLAHCLALELLLAYQKQGSARQKRDDLHKLALLNRANMHLRWW